MSDLAHETGLAREALYRALSESGNGSDPLARVQHFHYPDHVLIRLTLRVADR